MSENYAFMFPGQGSQYAGMREKLVSYSERVDSLFQQCNKVLDFDLLSVHS